LPLRRLGRPPQVLASAANGQFAGVGISADHAVREIKDSGMIKPYWLGKVGYDLTKEDLKAKYMLTNAPKR
jgi:hypothetical protein